MKKVYVIVETTIDNETKKVKKVNVDTGFESMERAKLYLKGFVNIDYQLDSSETIVIWKAIINTFRREIKEIELY